MAAAGAGRGDQQPRFWIVLNVHHDVTSVASSYKFLVPLWPVGGVGPDNIAALRRVGATGFGLGGSLFKPDMSVADIAARARACVDAWRASA